MNAIENRTAQAAANSAKNVAQKAAAFAGRPAVVGLAGLVMAGSSRAADIDPTAILASISGGVTVINAIGLAIISLVVVIKLFKWVQRVL